MSITLEPESTTVLNTSTDNASTRLRENFIACRLSFNFLGISKTLTADQKRLAASSFDADGESISAGKKLIDTKHDSWKSLTAIRSQATKFWKENSLPYPEMGIRLIKQDHIERFDSAFADFREQLEAGVRMLDAQFAEIKEAAQVRLGSLFDPADYPSSLVDEFGMEWNFPEINPPSYLQRLNPEVYAEQARRVSQRFDEAIEMAESAFIEELDKLVNHLAERLAGNDDGKPKIFRDSAVTNMGEFFTRFRDLNIRSNDQLDDLVERCESLMNGVQPQSLRDNEGLRRSLSTKLSSVQSSLDQLLVDRPRRNILRPNRRQED